MGGHPRYGGMAGSLSTSKAGSSLGGGIIDMIDTVISPDCRSDDGEDAAAVPNGEMDGMG